MTTLPLNGNPNYTMPADPAERDEIVIRPNGRDTARGERVATVGAPRCDDTLRWDGIDPAHYDRAVSTRFPGVVSPCRIEITGRKLRRFTGDLWGVAATVHFYDGETVPAVLPERGPMFFEWDFDQAFCRYCGRPGHGCYCDA